MAFQAIPVGMRVGVLLATAGLLLDIPNHLLPTSFLTTLAAPLGFTPQDFLFLVGQVAEIGHFLVFAGFFTIAMVALYTKVMEEERQQLEQETQADSDNGPQGRPSELLGDPEIEEVARLEALR